MRANSWLCSLIALLFAASTCASQAAKDSGTGLAVEVSVNNCTPRLTARVLLVDLESLQTQTTQSGELGTSTFLNLKPGDYAVVVAGKGCILPQIKQVKIAEGRMTRIRVLQLWDSKCAWVN